MLDSLCMHVVSHGDLRLLPKYVVTPAIDEMAPKLRISTNLARVLHREQPPNRLPASPAA